MAQPYSDRPSQAGSASEPDMAGEDLVSASTLDLVQASDREIAPGPSTFDAPSGSRESNDLKHRLSQWGGSHLQPADSDEEGSEYELLLDPSLPEEYARPGVPAARVTSHSTTSEEEKPMIVNEHGEEDSPYSEVRVAVRNYDVEAPCNTVSKLRTQFDTLDYGLNIISGACLDNRNGARHHRCFHEHHSFAP